MRSFIFDGREITTGTVGERGGRDLEGRPITPLFLTLLSKRGHVHVMSSYSAKSDIPRFEWLSAVFNHLFEKIGKGVHI